MKHEIELYQFSQISNIVAICQHSLGIGSFFFKKLTSGGISGWMEPDINTIVDGYSI